MPVRREFFQNVTNVLAIPELASFSFPYDDYDEQRHRPASAPRFAKPLRFRRRAKGRRP